MCVNKIKLKTAKKHNTFLKLHTMTMGQHLRGGALAVDKRCKE